MEGKIIAIVGAPASGKSFLVNKLKDYFNADAFFEGEAKDLPERIIENFSKQVRNFETIVYFRNERVEDFLKAIKLKKEGRNSVLDTFWITNQLYIESMLQDFERDVAVKLGKLDKEVLGFPDLIIFLQVDQQSIRNFIKLRGRNFDQDEAFIERILKVNKEHENFFKEEKFSNLLVIKRDELDFENESDFKLLVKRIKEKIEV